MRWVGIDEAGYGPNLGPMVMTAVVAESTDRTAQRPVPARRSTFGPTWGRPSIAPAVIRIGCGSMIPRPFIVAARDEIASRWPLWH